MTSVESEVTKNSQEYYLAVRIPTSLQIPVSFPTTPHSLKTVTYPFLPKDTPLDSSESYGDIVLRAAPISQTYAIIRTEPGANPWDLGSYYENFKSVMGNYWWDWLLPLRHSPCCCHQNEASEFPFGPVVDRLKRKYGLVPAHS